MTLRLPILQFRLPRRDPIYPHLVLLVTYRHLYPPTHVRPRHYHHQTLRTLVHQHHPDDFFVLIINHVTYRTVWFPVETWTFHPVRVMKTTKERQDLPNFRLLKPHRAHPGSRRNPNDNFGLMFPRKSSATNVGAHPPSVKPSAYAEKNTAFDASQHGAFHFLT